MRPVFGRSSVRTPDETLALLAGRQADHGNKVLAAWSAREGYMPTDPLTMVRLLRAATRLAAYARGAVIPGAARRGGRGGGPAARPAARLGRRRPGGGPAARGGRGRSRTVPWWRTGVGS